jgi:hypothetical protein
MTAVPHHAGETTMAAEKKGEKVQDLKDKKMADQKADNVKGGRMPLNPKK